MAEGKWIGGLTPEMALKKAARIVLEARLEVVGAILPTATQPGHDDPEHVHQLRVATRRADAALRIFRCCLPGKAYRLGRSRLRTVRRAAGAARDWDVFLIEIRQRSNNSPSQDLPGLDFLTGFACGQRAAAQRSLEQVEVDAAPSFDEHVESLLGELREPNDDGPTRLIDLARSLLEELLGKLHEKASGDLSDYNHLHQVRIAGKRLRYALELFAECSGPEMREHYYPMVEEMQEMLGRANDSHVAISRLTDLRARLRKTEEAWGRLRAGVEGCLRFHQRRLPQERRRFLKWWGCWISAGAEGMLSEPAVAPTTSDSQS